MFHTKYDSTVWYCCQLESYQLSATGIRIREERERLGLTQADLGVAPKTQRYYEIGERKPDTDYIERLAALGADVLYILTGRRDVTTLTREETALVDNYRAAPEVVKRSLRGAAAAWQEPDVKKASA